MQLRYNNYIRNRVVYMELETDNFTNKENEALQKFGEPVVQIEKTYDGGFPVSLERKIKTGFKVRQKFDGSNNIKQAVNAANEFFEDVVDQMRDKMNELMFDKYEDFEYSLEYGSGLKTIDY